MPIFTKGDERIYFAHIPKTAGSAIYLLFLRNGYALSNVKTGLGRRRIGWHLNREFGITDIPFEGKRHGFRGALQHAPARIWTRWGPFTSTFAVVREPYARALSALRYVHSNKNPEKLDFEAYKARRISDLAQQHADDPAALEPMFQPQHTFLAPDTRVLRFEDDWQGQLARTYALPIAEVEKINEGRSRSVPLTEDEREWIRLAYAEDFERFGYPH